MKIMKKIAAVAASAALFAAMAVSAFADYTYSLDNTSLVSDIQADSYTINGAEGVFEKNDLQAAETDDAIGMRFSIFNEYLETSYWDDPNVVVSVDVKLETEGVNVMGFIAGFDRGWKWINPSNYVTLEYGKWVTVSETGPHFQEIWNKRGPNQFMFQVRANWDAGAQGAVKVSIRNFRITDGKGNTTVVQPEETTTTVTTTTEATTTTADTTTAASEDAEPTEVQTAEPVESAEQPAPTEEAAEVVATTAATTAATSVTEATTIQTAATEAAAPDMSQIVLERPNAKKDTATVIIVVVAVVVVVVAAIVIGYIIYKKKMFY